MAESRSRSRTPRSRTPKRSRSRAASGKRRTASNPRRWSARVTRESDALDLQNRVFAQPDPGKIARSLKRSAARSKRRKSSPYRAAMSMLTFFINRAGRNLSAAQKRKLERAKIELRKLFHKA